MASGGPDGPPLARALARARAAHAGGFKKNGRPVFDHVVGVLLLVHEVGRVDDSDVLCAALLHDTIEAGAETADSLNDAFPGRVAGLVVELTDPPDAASESERRERQVRHAATLSADARLIKLADKVDNTDAYIRCPPGFWSRERLRSYHQWSARVVRALAGTCPALEDRFAPLPDPG